MYIRPTLVETRPASHRTSVYAAQSSRNSTTDEPVGLHQPIRLVPCARCRL